MRGQRRLDKNSVNIASGVEYFYKIEQFVLGSFFRKLVYFGFKSHFLTGFCLVSHIYFGSRIFSYYDYRKSGFNSGFRFELGRLFPYLCSYLCGKSLSVHYYCHVYIFLSKIMCFKIICVNEAHFGIWRLRVFAVLVQTVYHTYCILRQTS